MCWKFNEIYIENKNNTGKIRGCIMDKLISTQRKKNMESWWILLKITGIILGISNLLFGDRSYNKEIFVVMSQKATEWSWVMRFSESRFMSRNYRNIFRTISKGVLDICKNLSEKSRMRSIERDIKKIVTNK